VDRSQPGDVLAGARPSRRLLLVIFLCGAAVTFDGYDLQMLSYVVPTIVREWHISPVQAGLLGSWTFLGLFVGAVVLGAVGDRWGRKRTLILGITIFGVCMGSAGFAADYTQLAALRFAAGIGMGGVLPGAITMLGEYAPDRLRARAVALTTGCFTLGFVFAALLAIAIVPGHGWRPMFQLSYLSLVVGVLVLLWVPESPRYLARRGRYGDAADALRTLYPSLEEKIRQATPEALWGEQPAGGNRVPLRMLWSRVYLASTIKVSFLYFFVQFVVYALDFWLVSLLVAHGFSLVRSYSYGIEQALAATLGGLALAWMVDRVDRRLSIAAIFLGGGVSLVLFGFSSTSAELYVLNFLAGGLIIGGQNVVHVLVMAVYGTELRATAIGWALGIGRLGGILGPLVGGFLLSRAMPFPAYFVIFAVPAILASVTILLLPGRRATASQPVPQTEPAGLSE
jgi:MFS transporter, AAHS family, benzoate transport protein